MAITIGINGFGRIGRVAFRIAINQPEKFKICGINVRNADLDYMIYMIRYDSIFGRFQGSLEKYEEGIVVMARRSKCIQKMMLLTFRGESVEQNTL